MRPSTLIIALTGILSMAAPGVAQSYAGTYTLQTSEGINTMILHQDAGGNVQGEITMEGGEKVALRGNVQGDQVVGIATMAQGSSLFKLTSQGQQVTFTIIPVTADNTPDLAHAQQFPFSRQGGAGAGRQTMADGGAKVGGNPLAGGVGAAASGPFAGEFSDGNVVLELEGDGGRYQGQLEFQGNTFPVEARTPDGRSLRGQFTTGSKSFDFTARLEGGVLVFVTGGTTYRLRSQSEEPAGGGNPLAGGAPSTGGSPLAGSATGYGADTGGNPAGAAGAGDGIQRDPRAPATPGRLSDDNPQSLQWLDGLRGKLLTQLSSYSSGTAGGTSSRQRMVLYPNGQFEYYSFSSVSVDVGGAFGNAGDQGTQRGSWRIVTAQGTSYLALVFEGSTEEEYAELDLQDGKVYVDGVRTFVTNPQ